MKPSLRQQRECACTCEPGGRGLTVLTESAVEQTSLAWLQGAGRSVLHGDGIAPGEPAAERNDYGPVVLSARLRDALAWLNPELPAAALENALRKLTRPDLRSAPSSAQARGAELVAHGGG